MATTFKLTGVTKMHKLLVKAAKETPQLAAAALRREAEAIMADSKENFVPIDQGVLRASGYVRAAPGSKAGNIAVMLGYGGAARAYALAVHENPSKHDPPSWKGKTILFKPSGRGPKYLERPLKNAAATLAERLAARLQEALKEAAAP
jgi:hypothetical protein